MLKTLKSFFRDVAQFDKDHCIVRYFGYEWTIERCDISISTDAGSRIVPGYRVEAYLPGELDYEFSRQDEDLIQLCEAIEGTGRF